MEIYPMANITTHADRIAYAKANRTCFACANYCGQFSRFTAYCTEGGLDPEWTAAAHTEQTAAIRATVGWSNRCPRFAAVEEVLPRAAESYIPAIAA
jgi:hypothetical protein